MSKNEQNVWVIHMKRLRHEAELLENINKGFISIGWKVVDLRKLKDRDAIIEALQALPGYKLDAIPQHASILYKFGYLMKKGDYVVLPVSGTQIVKIGEITDDKLYRDESFDDEYVHQRKVKWLKEVDREEFSQDARNSMGTTLTVTQGSQVVSEETIKLAQGKQVEKAETGEEEFIDLEALIEERLDAFITQKIGENLQHNYTRIVAAILKAMGYVTEIAPPGPDGKRDIMAYPDDLRLHDPMIRVEVKSSQYAIKEDDVRALKGALRGNEKGLFVARSGYTKNARKFAHDIPNLTLLDGEDIVQLLLKHYDKLDEETQEIIPLKKVWIPRT